MKESPHITADSARAFVLFVGLMAAVVTAKKPAYGLPLEGTDWRAVELAGKPAPPQDAKRGARLLFDAAGGVSGSDGCNRVTGSYQRKGDAITFGPMAATRIACADTAAVEEAFRSALKATSRFTIAGDRLELFDAAGMRVAAFVAGTPAAAAPRLGTRTDTLSSR